VRRDLPVLDEYLDGLTEAGAGRVVQRCRVESLDAGGTRRVAGTAIVRVGAVFVGAG
jgi:hypothetical protein